MFLINMAVGGLVDFYPKGQVHPATGRLGGRQALFDTKRRSKIYRMNADGLPPW